MGHLPWSTHVGTGSASSEPAEPQVTGLPIVGVLNVTLACWDYDRTKALLEGRLGVDGCQVDATCLPPETLFPMAFGSAEFDISELSLSSYIMQVSRGECAYVAIPAFVSRAFRHGAIYTRTDRGVDHPKHLEGRIIGIPEYQMTAGLWVRGILQDEYGVDLERIRYRTGGTNKAGRKERLSLTLPPQMEVIPVRDGTTLNELLIAGDIDAVFSPTPPDAYVDGNPLVTRLFRDVATVERSYFDKTGLFPIMHVIGIRRTLAEAHPWLAPNVYRAFLLARREAMANLEATAAASANRVSLPWFSNEFEETKRLMGDDFWPYGVKENRRDMETACRYAHEQHLTDREIGIDELFAGDSRAIPGA